ncbi:MAG: hypothetical protein AAGH40_06535 [Verrucomicrobiota bacterium]
MKLSSIKILTLSTAAFLILSCNREGTGRPHAAEEGEQPTNRVEIPSSVRSNLGITFAEVERRQIANTIRVPGSFELMPKARHEYRQLLAGFIQFEVKQFDPVEAGQLLYRFRSNDWLSMQSEIDLLLASCEQAKAKLEAGENRIAALARADFKRADLETDVAVLRADLAKQNAALGSALSRAAKILSYKRGSDETDDLLLEVNGIPRYRSIDWIEVRAIESGVVESLAVTDGSFAEEASLVVTTVNPEKIRFRASGLQSDLPKYKNGQQVRIVPPQGDGSAMNEAVFGELAVGVIADPTRRTIPLYAIPSEISSWTRPGVSAFLEIVAEDSGGFVLAIPKAAVVKDGIVHVFFKRDPLNANKAIRVEADLGIDDGRWVEVKSGIGPSEEVVLEGVYELKLATAQSGTSQKGGHFHADGSFHAEEH